ncbi:predicted protein [Naegleria gruberi]|uniref:Predicted protein n=1 Tax=Naegleria gruberi TaxID=5762 RepID=D2W526_NAEGR|nr:uncharacterized protein NAEGRDRAFT_82342 [Naegleria gruberi]EFC35824.1 predicted protein [Naegleria gruberi]|eukprot:XP_002668568.1 predicted protein [Naegleria gruberi strain NEG-M]
MTTRINILPDELQLAAGVLSLPNIFEIKYSAPVRLYKANNGNQWSYANSYGILTVTLVEKQSVVMIRLVDLKSKSVTMEQECYEGFDYQTLSSNFHAFESDDGFVGLLFAERFDADQFAKQVCQLIRLKATGSINGSTPSLPSTKPSVNMRSDSSDSSSSSPTGTGSSTAPPTPVKKTNPPPSTPPPVANKPTAVNTSIAASSSVHTTSTTSSHKEPEKKHIPSNSSSGGSSSSGGGLFSKIFGTKNKDQIPDRSQIKISGPKVDKFKHVSHIGFDPKLGFTEIPPQLKTIFEKAGISEAELKDKKTAKFLMKTLVTVTSDAPPPPSLDVPISVGIDFTASNGGFTSSSSLHYLSSKKNHYQQALAQVLQILEPYDSDKIYGAYGYGARIDKELKMNPMFNLSLSDKEELCVGEILEAYEKAVPRLSFGDMGSATNPKTGKPYRGDDFYRVIEHVVERTPPVTQQQQFYNILLLIIDGDAFDMQGTIDSIIEANDKPISIVIVGIGGRSFPSCRKFDADDEPLIHSNGTKMTRDIVQFVSFSECSDLTQLASEVLAEIPKQMVTYFESKEIIPNPRPQSAFY